MGSCLPALALQDAPGLAAARVIAGAGHAFAELDTLAILAVFVQRTVRQPLLVPQLDAAQIENAILHCCRDFLAAPCLGALEKRRDDAEAKMQTCAGIADLCSGNQRQTVAEACRRGRTAGALRDVFVNLAVLIGTGAESLDRRNDHCRIELLDTLPREPHAIERTRSEILHQHIAIFDQFFQNGLPALVLGIERDRTFVVIEHGEIEAIHLGDVAQLAARDITNSRALDLDDIGTKPGKKLCACRPRLNMGEIQDANTLQSFRHSFLPFFWRGTCSFVLLSVDWSRRPL